MKHARRSIFFSFRGRLFSVTSEHNGLFDTAAV
jgi:hypothetical protein